MGCCNGAFRGVKEEKRYNIDKENSQESPKMYHNKTVILSTMKTRLGVVTDAEHPMAKYVFPRTATL